MNKLKLTILILITLFLSLGLSACVKKPAVNTNLNINTVTRTEEIDTSDWKTYRNKEYGFEFKYPEEWIYYNLTKEKDNGELEYIYDPKKINEASFTDKIVIDERKLGFGIAVLRLSIKESASNLKDYIETEFSTCDEIKTAEAENTEFVKIKCDGYADPNYYIGKKDKQFYVFSSFGSMNNYLDIVVENLKIK